MDQKQNRRLLAAFLSCLLIYLFHIGPLPGVAENRYIDQTRSIVDEGRFDIDSYHHNTVDKGLSNGHFYPTAPPGMPILSVPVYLFAKLLFQYVPINVFRQFDVGGYLHNVVGGTIVPDEFVANYPFSEFLLLHVLFTAVFCSASAAVIMIMVDRGLGLLTPECTAGQRLFIMVIFAFGTLMFFYASRYFAHALSTMFLFAGFLLLVSIKRQTRGDGWILVAGISNALSVLTDYIALPAAVAVGLYGLWVLPNRKIWRYILGNSMAMLCLFTYHTVYFGHPLAMPQTFMTGENEQVFSESMGLSFPDPIIAGKLLFSSYRGLFMYMPILLCSAYALVRGLLDRHYPHRKEWVLIACILVLLLLFNSSMKSIWNGGHVFGPRYLIPSIPFLMIPLGMAHRWIPRPILTALGALSILINWSGVQYIVSQTSFGSLAMFFLSGPTTQGYQFLKKYFHSMADWDVYISPMGGFILLAVTIYGLWRFIIGSVDVPGSALDE